MKMMTKMTKTKQFATTATIAATLALFSGTLAPNALAQTATVKHASPAPTHKPNIVQRHPTATGVAAGVATHSALKRSAAAKKRAHKKLNFAERHPTISGLAAGVATTKTIKKTTHK